MVGPKGDLEERKDLPVWRYAEGLVIPKEERSENIDQFQIISFLTVEIKIFFSTVVKRLFNFRLSNNYIDTAVQKGGTPRSLVKLGHHTCVQRIRQPREGRGDLAVLWLDLTSAYYSVPHKLIEVDLLTSD